MSLPPSFFVAFGPHISGPPVPRCGFCGVEAEGKGKGKKEKRGKRTGKTDVSARVVRGMCLAPCWLLGEAGRAVMFKKNRSPRAPRGARGASSISTRE